MENETITGDSSLCGCPNALSLVATPFHKICYMCRKVIDIGAWKSWRVAGPYEEMLWFAFALRRDDGDELKDAPDSLFKAEILAVMELMENEHFEQS